jgi:hypothetical protein
VHAGRPAGIRSVEARVPRRSHKQLRRKVWKRGQRVLRGSQAALRGAAGGADASPSRDRLCVCGGQAPRNAYRLTSGIANRWGNRPRACG